MTKNNRPWKGQYHRPKTILRLLVVPSDKAALEAHVIDSKVVYTPVQIYCLSDDYAFMED